MTQARGANAQLLIQRETTFRTAPVSPAAFRLPFTTFDTGVDPGKVDNPSISNSPLPEKMGEGNRVLTPKLDSIFDLRSIGQVLALLLGVPTAYKAVTTQPVNCTGVTANYAHATATTGDGTLAFVASAHTLAWKAQGDGTAGTPVDVSAGGYFTLQSGTVDHWLHVTVDSASLALTDKTDATIAVSATLKAHVFPYNMTDRPSALFDLGLTDISKYYRVFGAKASTLDFDIGAKDQNISVGFLAGYETDSGTVWDATPTAYTAVRAAAGGGSIWNGVDTSLGTVTGGKISVSNGMQGYLGLPPDTGTIAANVGYGVIDQAGVDLKGTLSAVFDGSGSFAKARAGTSSRFRAVSRAQVSTDVFALIWDMPSVEFTEKGAPIKGKSGLFVELDWKAHRNAAGSVPLVMLVNDVAGY